ncbi:MAG: sigma-70 family RNA polymerase sigma factor [Bryobacterales bacterium]|nr:sigma-70 family RNA polymerase sigma factor [Bryobacterales bacterium]
MAEIHKSEIQAEQRASEAGQRNAVAQLWDEYAPGMLRFALLCTRSREVAEESVQEAFTAILGRIRCGDEVRDNREFLYGALCEAIELRRTEFAAPPVDPEAPEWDSPDLDAPLRAAEVQKKLNRIASPRELEMLHLRAAGFSYLEIARVLMISPGTVASTLARVFRKVRKAFSGVTP